jgi:hypothetical protein
LTPDGARGYSDLVATTDRLLDSLRDLLTAANPGLVTQADLRRLEDKLDELLELADAIETRLAAKERQSKD